VSIQPNLLPTLRAAIDRIIPADEFPSATQSDVDQFIVALLAGDRKNDATFFESGLSSLDAEAKALGDKSFGGSSTEIQDQILKLVERGQTGIKWPISPNQFFDLLLNLTAEGYFSDPGNGGNKDAASWAMVGYDPGANRP
jgi:hypothetical protein